MFQVYRKENLLCISNVLFYRYVCVCISQKKVKSEVKMLVSQSSLTLCDPMDCSPSGFSVHGIVQTKILEWV